MLLWVRIRSRGKDYREVRDTGATISIGAKKILRLGDLKNIMPTAPIRRGDGHVVHNCGDCEVDPPMGSTSIVHRFYVLDSEAYHFVGGTNFFAEHPPDSMPHAASVVCPPY